MQRAIFFLCNSYFSNGFGQLLEKKKKDRPESPNSTLLLTLRQIFLVPFFTVFLSLPICKVATITVTFPQESREEQQMFAERL